MEIFIEANSTIESSLFGYERGCFLVMRTPRVHGRWLGHANLSRSGGHLVIITRAALGQLDIRENDMPAVPVRGRWDHRNPATRGSNPYSTSRVPKASCLSKPSVLHENRNYVSICEVGSAFL